MNKRAQDIQQRFCLYLRESPTADEDMDRLCLLDKMDKDAMMEFTVDLGREFDKAKSDNLKYARLALDECFCASALDEIEEILDDDGDHERLREAIQQVKTKLDAFDTLGKLFGSIAESLQ